MTTLRAILAVCLVAAVAIADDDGKAPPPPGEKPGEPAPPAKPPETKPAPKPAEEPVRGLMYSIKLRSGRIVHGVVRERGIWERKDRELGWVASKRDEEGAGIRLWYPSLLDGFIYVRAKDVAQVDDLGALSAEYGLKINRARADAAATAEAERVRLKDEAQRRAAQDEARAALERDAADARRTRSEDAAKALAESGALIPLDRAKRFTELLEKYPPTHWKPETPKEIERRRVTLDLFPTDEEKGFLNDYAEWREAYEFWKKGRPSDAPTPPAPGGDAGAAAPAPPSRPSDAAAK